MSPKPTARPDASRLAALGSIAGLAILKIVMLAALFTQTPPHPPLGFAPLFGASLALSALCVALICTRSRWFSAPSILVILESLLSFGPQKLYPGESSFFAQSVAVYPVIFVGSALILILGVASWSLFGTFKARAHEPGLPADTIARHGS